MKYELTTNTKEYCGLTLYQIKALKDFGNVKAGDLGGWVASEKNLSQEGNCWVSDNAKAYGSAWVYDNAWVFDNAKVSGNAKAYGSAWVYGNAKVSDNAKAYGSAWVYDNAKVYGDAVVSGNAKVKRGKYCEAPVSIARSDGYTFTLQSDMSIVAGCRDFTPEEADKHWGDPKHHKHKESWTIVQALRAIHKAKEE